MGSVGAIRDFQSIFHHLSSFEQIIQSNHSNDLTISPNGLIDYDRNQLENEWDEDVHRWGSKVKRGDPSVERFFSSNVKTGFIDHA